MKWKPFSGYFVNTAEKLFLLLFVFPVLLTCLCFCLFSPASGVQVSTSLLPSRFIFANATSLAAPYLHHGDILKCAYTGECFQGWVFVLLFSPAVVNAVAIEEAFHPLFK